MSEQGFQRKGPGPNIIRAWFDTVVNPLIEALRSERRCLERTDWTWNHWRGVLESVGLVESYLDYAVLPNLRQFFRYNSDCMALADQHDDIQQHLQGVCREIQSLLEASEELHSLYQKAISTESLAVIGKDVVTLFGATSTDRERIALLADYIINSRPELPDYYTVAPLWNKWRDKLLTLQFHTSPSISVRFEKLFNTGAMLAELDGKFITLLEERREVLSIENDVPPVNLAA